MNSEIATETAQHAVTMFGTVPGWLTTLFTGGIFGVACSTWLKYRAQQASDKRDDRQGYGNLIERMDESLKTLTERITLAEEKAQVAEEKAQVAQTAAKKTENKCEKMQLQLSQYQFVMGMLSAEMERMDPDNSTLKQVRHLLARIYPADTETSMDFKVRLEEID